MTTSNESKSSAPVVKGTRDAFYLLSLCVWSGDGQVSFIRRDGLRFRVTLRPLFLNMRFQLADSKRLFKQLEKWGYIYNLNLLNAGEARFTVNLPKFLDLVPWEKGVPTDRNFS